MGLLTFDVGADTGLLTFGGTDHLLTFHDLAITPTSINRGQINFAYEQETSFSAIGGTGPYTWQCLSTPPAGTTFDAINRIFTGTPLVGGTYALIIQVTDSTGTIGNYAVAWIISSTVISIMPPTIDAGTEEAAYVQTTPFTATGGAAPYTYSLDSGTPPPGTAFNPTARIFQGIATTPGNFTGLVIKVVDANGDVGFLTVSIKINALTGTVIEANITLDIRVATTGWTLRAYTSESWHDSPGNLILDDNPGGKDAYFVANFTSNNVPQIRLPNTTDSPDNPFVRYTTLQIYDDKGRKKFKPLLSNFFLRPDLGSPITLITLKNSQKTVPFYNKTGLDLFMASLYVYINQYIDTHGGSGDVDGGTP